MRKIKLSAISDLNGNLPNQSEFVEGDVLCICGDIVPLDLQSNDVKSIAWFCAEFIPWTDKLPFKKVIVIFGNHDFFGERLYGGGKNDGTGITSLLLPGNIKGKHKVVILCDNSYKYMGFTFYGTSWCPDLSAWAFYGGHDKLVEKYSKIPQHVDVLLTHCPPRIGDVGVVLQTCWNSMRNFGCQELAEEIEIKRPCWVFSGHIHSGDYGITDHDEGVKIVNVSMLDENYKKSYPPFNTEIIKESSEE